jgi:hypothetical protein
MCNHVDLNGKINVCLSFLCCSFSSSLVPSDLGDTSWLTFQLRVCCPLQFSPARARGPVLLKVLAFLLVFSDSHATDLPLSWSSFFSQGMILCQQAHQAWHLHRFAVPVHSPLRFPFFYSHFSCHCRSRNSVAVGFFVS